ncbi:MAG: GDP-mannose dehydrogenase, partial [Desulfomonile tiedjei]|nr:GDP-mannose dehydrogenase [Desulfomonile tiedjei]
KALDEADVVIFAVRHKQFMDLDPAKVVEAAGGPLAVIDCFGILDDEKIRQYFELGCEVKGLGRGHINRLKKLYKKPR